MDDPNPISEIIKKAGGPDAIAEKSAGKLTRWAVYKWAGNGVPDQHWPLLMEMANVSADDMLAANVSIRHAEAAE